MAKQTFSALFGPTFLTDPLQNQGRFFKKKSSELQIYTQRALQLAGEMDSLNSSELSKR